MRPKILFRWVILLSLVLVQFPDAVLAGQGANYCAPRVLNTESEAGRHRAISYYWSKIKELQNIDKSAPMAVAVRALIWTTKINVRKVYIPLEKLKYIHPITTEAASEKTLERMSSLLKNQHRIFDGTQPRFSIRLQELLIPSKNPIRVIADGEGGFVVFDGNGRLAAIQEAFKAQEDLRIEVEWFVSDSKLLLRALDSLLQKRELQ